MDSIKEPGMMQNNMGEDVGPLDTTYPFVVKYCGHCSMPIEYCEFYSEYDKCKECLAQNYPDDYEKLKLKESSPGSNVDKKRQKRGGKGLRRIEKDSCDNDNAAKRICLSCVTRSKNKRVTIVAGLSAFNIDLRAAAKFFGSKFACGCSVTGDNEIVIQGDVKNELFRVIPEKWHEISQAVIEDCAEIKRQLQQK